MLPKSWLNNIDLEKVRPHNLAARALANTVCPEFDILEKDEYGKPYFESSKHKISITHSGEYAAFMYKTDDDCGIDMEELNGRIRRIVSKFMREDEEEFLNHEDDGMYIVWCAKEALYKYYGLKSLDFKDHLKVEYSPIEKQGTLTGHISKKDYYKKVMLEYQFLDQYLLVYTI